MLANRRTGTARRTERGPFRTVAFAVTEAGKDRQRHSSDRPKCLINVATEILRHLSGIARLTQITAQADAPIAPQAHDHIVQGYLPLA